MPTVGFTVSVDTEEDNWLPTRQDVTTTNIGQLTRLDDHFRSLGIRATYFVTYQVAACQVSAAVLCAIHDRGGAEIGAHLHPWNTPPECGLEDRVSMLKEYPAQSQCDKVEALVAAIRSNLGVQPVSFRAGRFGFGQSTAAALQRNGILVDSSVTPLLNWESYDNGPSYVRAPLRVYRFNDGDVLDPSDDGSMIEVPVSVGYTRFTLENWTQLTQWLEKPTARRLRLPGLASRLGLFERVVLSPETSGTTEMLRAARALIRGGSQHLHMFLHSSSLVPGLSPFVRTREEVKSLFGRIEGFVHGMSRYARLEFCTVSEAADRFASRSEDSNLGRQMRAALPAPSLMQAGF